MTKQDLTKCCLKEMHIKYKDTDRLKNKSVGNYMP